MSSPHAHVSLTFEKLHASYCELCFVLSADVSCCPPSGAESYGRLMTNNQRGRPPKFRSVLH
eukprot:6183914-Pleurochrysis_carterae.AAC.1